MRGDETCCMLIDNRRILYDWYFETKIIVFAWKRSQRSIRSHYNHNQNQTICPLVVDEEEEA